MLARHRAWIGAALLLAGCASRPAPSSKILLRYDKPAEPEDLQSLISRAGSEPVSVANLGRTAWVSHHLAVVREGEVPHYHRFHDLTVVVLRGEGVIDIEGRKYEMKAGDVVHVNRGVRHFFRNTGKDVAVAFVTFSPPFDGRDTITADTPPDSATAPPAAPAPTP